MHEAIDDKRSTEQLLRSAQKRDVQALSELLRQQQDTLLKFVRGLIPANLQSQVGAEDILQDAYFLAFRHIGTFKGDSDAFRRWLGTIARNCLIDHLRAQQTQKRGGVSAMGNADPAGSIVWMLEELSVYLRTPSQSAARHELVAAIETALEAIPPNYGIALKLRYIEQLPVAQVAERMNTTEGAVHMLCNRGLKALRVQMRSRTLYL